MIALQPGTSDNCLTRGCGGAHCGGHAGGALLLEVMGVMRKGRGSQSEEGVKLQEDSQQGSEGERRVWVQWVVGKHAAQKCANGDNTASDDVAIVVGSRTML